MVSLGVSTFLPGQPPAPEASDQPWQPVLISCMRDLPHTSTRRPVLILPASPEGDSEVQRHHVTYPEVAQQIYSRAECWPAWLQPGCFPSERQFRHHPAAKGAQSRAAVGAPWNKRWPLLGGGGQWLVGSWRDTLASPYTWRKGLKPSSSSASPRGNELPRKPSAKAGTPPICWAESPKLTPGAQPSGMEGPWRARDEVPSTEPDPQMGGSRQPPGMFRGRRLRSSWAGACQGGGGGFTLRPADWLRVAMSGGVCSILSVCAAGVTSGRRAGACVARRQCGLEAAGTLHLIYSSGFSRRSAAPVTSRRLFTARCREEAGAVPAVGGVP